MDPGTPEGTWGPQKGHWELTRDLKTDAGTPQVTPGVTWGPQKGHWELIGDPKGDPGTPRRPREGHRDVPADLAGTGALGDGDAEGVRGGRDVVPPRPAGL